MIKKRKKTKLEKGVLDILRVDTKKGRIPKKKRKLEKLEKKVEKNIKSGVAKNLFKVFGSKRKKKVSEKPKNKGKKLFGVPEILKRVNFIIGKPKDRERDKKLHALPPGWRRSKSGRKYYENRVNHADLKGEV